ncbi:MAG: hypothetical protein KKH85_10555 [Proteobacteria bacterium]|nr:hypothetical protein [Pseudomonadota bacterium]
MGETYFWHEAIYHFRHRYASVVADELMIIGHVFGEIMEIALRLGMGNTYYDLFELGRRPTAESILLLFQPKASSSKCVEAK